MSISKFGVYLNRYIISREIYSNNYLHHTSSKRFTNSSYHCKRPLDPWFITGLTDGDGTFTIVIRIIKSKLHFSGYFEIAGKNNKAVYDLFSAVKIYFNNIGEIKKRGNSLSYVVTKKNRFKNNNSSFWKVSFKNNKVKLLLYI